MAAFGRLSGKEWRFGGIDSGGTGIWQDRGSDLWACDKLLRSDHADQG